MSPAYDRRMASIRLSAVLLLGLVPTCVFAATGSQSTAPQLLHQALEAQGGEQILRGLRNVQWSLAGYRNMLEQSERPEGPYVTEFDSTTEVYDFRGNRYLNITEATVYTVFKFSRGTVVTNENAMRLANSQKLAGTPQEMQLAHERLSLSPERVLLTALDASDVHRERDAVLQSVPQNVAAFTLDGAPVHVFLNANTHLPTAVDYSGPLARTGLAVFR